MNVKHLPTLLLLVTLGLSQNFNSSVEHNSENTPDTEALRQQAEAELNQYYANVHQQFVQKNDRLAQTFQALNASGPVSQSAWESAANEILAQQVPDNANWTITDEELPTGAQQTPWVLLGPPYASASRRSSYSGTRSSYTILSQTFQWSDGSLGNADAHYLSGADDDDRFVSTLTTSITDIYNVPRQGRLQVHVRVISGTNRGTITNDDEFGFSGCSISLVNRGELRALSAVASRVMWSLSTTNTDSRINVYPVPNGRVVEFTMTSEFFVNPGPIAISYTNVHSRSVYVNDVTTLSVMTDNWRVSGLWARIE